MTTDRPVAMPCGRIVYVTGAPHAHQNRCRDCLTKDGAYLPERVREGIFLALRDRPLGARLAGCDEWKRQEGDRLLAEMDARNPSDAIQITVTNAGAPVAVADVRRHVERVAKRRVYVRKSDDVWTWSCPSCMYWCWTRSGFPRALAEAIRHQHWRGTSTDD